MSPIFYAEKENIDVISAGEIACTVTFSDSNMMDVWIDATIDFTFYHDTDTTGLPFVFEASLADIDTGVVKEQAVYIACMAYFIKRKKKQKIIYFGAVSAIGAVDKVTIEQVINVARNEQKKARKILAEVMKQCL